MQVKMLCDHTRWHRGGRVSSRKPRKQCSRCPKHVGPCDWEWVGGTLEGEPQEWGSLSGSCPVAEGRNSWGGGWVGPLKEPEHRAVGMEQMSGQRSEAMS